MSVSHKTRRVRKHKKIPVRIVPNYKFSGDLLRENREGKGYGISQLAALVGCNHSVISRAEKKSLDLLGSTLLRVAKAVGCKPGELYEEVL